MNEIRSDYSTKPGQYFSGARKLFVDELPPNSVARLLEIGCGNGDTSVYAKQSGKCGWTFGVELCEGPGKEAKNRLDDVIIGDIEQLNFPQSAGLFDILIMSEVIEHLRDPWATLRRLRAILKPGAIVLSGSPNVAHWEVLAMLWRGRWDYTSTGVMDRTHLRWFTPDTYRELFKDCGFDVQFSLPAAPLRSKPRILNMLTLGRYQYFFHPQIYLKAVRR